MAKDTQGFYEAIEGFHSKLKERDDDLVIVIDGTEGTGKSTLAMDIGLRLENQDELLKNMIFNEDDFIDTLDQLWEYPPGTVHIVDEGHNVFARKRASTLFMTYIEDVLRTTRTLQQCWIILTPRIWEMNHTILERADVFIHVKGRGDAVAWTHENAQMILNVVLKARRSRVITSFDQVKNMMRKWGYYPIKFADIEFEAVDNEFYSDYLEKKREQTVEMIKSRMARIREKQKGKVCDDGEDDDKQGDGNGKKDWDDETKKRVVIKIDRMKEAKIPLYEACELEGISKDTYRKWRTRFKISAATT